MSQSHQRASLPGCPSCEEPLESGDRFCGACGYDLSAVPAPPADRPTVAITLPTPGAGTPAPGAGTPDTGTPAPGTGTPPGGPSEAGAVQWPAASKVDSSDLPAP
ncbi:zinc ribbon domain-containing protein, partial [Streptomyces halstedii]|uniref:zinc ribbon domain-containing protein n=1 Tax=Streptomyces halstedii TaxID=1944 RepID=UPI001940A663